LLIVKKSLGKASPHVNTNQGLTAILILIFKIRIADLRPLTLTKNYLSDKSFVSLRRVGNRNKYVKKYGQNSGFSVFIHITAIQIN